MPIVCLVLVAAARADARSAPGPGPRPGTAPAARSGYAPRLPFTTRFVGVDRFHELARRAARGGWRALPFPDRIIAVARALEGTRYKGFTLDIDNRIEEPSVNLEGLDCWTLFEISVGFARMLTLKPAGAQPDDLLRMIELDRYRGGRCTGDYLSRLHYLADWFVDNARRGLIVDLTRELGAERIRRRCSEMTHLWRSYRYLRVNPDLRVRMAREEARISALRMYHVPRERVAHIEPRLRNGDIIGITSAQDGAFCSHVGLACRTGGVLRFLHASSNEKRVILDSRLSVYLHRFNSIAGIMVARPLDLAPAPAPR